MDLSQRLADYQRRGLTRRHRVNLGPQQVRLQEADHELVSFCSNDYLGMANHPDVCQAFKEAVDRYGVGSGAAHLVTGHSHAHQQLEQELAAFTGRERVLLFSTGYMANLGAINGLLGKADAIFQDRLNHASLLDAGLLSGARFQRYLHNDVASLEQRLARTEGRRKLVVTDGVFSMDGDLAPLPALSAATRAQGGWLMVDDAHGFGCIGRGGRGIVDHFNLGTDDVPVLVGTLGKAFGTAGAFVAGSSALIETLIQFARTYIYTTSMPPAVACASLASLRLLERDDWRREHLNALIGRFRAGCQQLGLALMDSPTPIQPILIGEADAAMAISAGLEARGIFVGAIRPPTVPAGSARLRVTLSASHSEAQVDELLDALGQVIGSGLHGAHA